MKSELGRQKKRLESAYLQVHHVRNGLKSAYLQCTMSEMVYLKNDQHSVHKINLMEYTAINLMEYTAVQSVMRVTKYHSEPTGYPVLY